MFKDDLGHEIIVNLRDVKAVTTYAKEKKRKDENPLSATFGEDISSGVRFYIKYELGDDFFKLETFKSEHQRDEVFKKISSMLLNRFSAHGDHEH